MDEIRYRLLIRLAIALTVAWIAWTLIDSGLIKWDPGAYELEAARKKS